MAGTILDLEAERQAEAEERVLFADDLLPGVGDEELTLADGLRVGGTFTFVIVALLVALDELESATLGTLAPDIARLARHQRWRDRSSSVPQPAASWCSGRCPMGWLADRYRRGRIIGLASLVFSAMVLLSGLAVNGFMLFFARMGVGVAKSNQLPVQGSLLADTYPIGTRGRISASVAIAGRVTGTLSPLLVGAYRRRSPAAAPAGGGRSSSSPSRRRSPPSSRSACRSRPRASSRSRTCSAR